MAAEIQLRRCLNEEIKIRITGKNCYNPAMEKTGKEKTTEIVIPKRRLGRTGLDVTILGLGGEGILRTYGQEEKAERLINTALDLGINYMESARAYDGSEAYYGNSLKGRRSDVVLASKSHARDRAGAMAHLEETLRNMRTDYLDIWYVHDMRSEEDMEKVFGPGGAMEAFTQARDRGDVKYLGVTGHHDPVIIRRCLEEFDFDVVLIPVNPAEPSHKCFLEEVVPVAGAKDVGVVGMKVYLRGMIEAPKKLLFCYALTQPITTAAIGCDSADQLKENAEIASKFITLKYKEVKRFTEFISPYARELMYYKP